MAFRVRPVYLSGRWSPLDILLKRIPLITKSSCLIILIRSRILHSETSQSTSLINSKLHLQRYMIRNQPGFFEGFHLLIKVNNFGADERYG